MLYRHDWTFPFWWIQFAPAGADSSLTLNAGIAAADLAPWIAQARQSLVASFDNGVEKDEAAVRAAIVLPWSNGQTEGQITRLKLVKRQMYGRAKLDLLHARLIGAD